MSSKTKTTATKEEAKPALVPKLRFPEFRGAEAWTPSVLANACNMQAGKFVSVSNISERNQDGLFPCYGGNGLRGYTATHTHDGTYPLIGRQGALCGNVRLVSGQFHATEHAVVTTPKAAIDVGWLYYSLDLLNLNRFATGQAQPGLSVDVLENVSLPIPPLETEQQKIAECLSSVDELMAVQARKVDALKAHKRGLMQQLFPREGETQPRLRFPEFKKAGAWKPRNAGTLFANRVTKGEQGLPIYSVTMHDGMVKRDSFDRNFYDIEDAAANKKVCKEDIAYNMMRMWQGALGVAPEDCLVSPAYIVLAPMKDAVPVFFQYLFKLPETLLLLTSHSRGLTKDRLRLYYDDFASIPLRCPAPSEQQRIASCLGSLDTLITFEAQKLEALKTHKKGLMQQLFPSPDSGHWH
ncbi:MAG: restriction endonuclease subunit S [Xanthomonadaceae bacterium]|nr:restriction endonuclease subunit S [Xanthomonadaceae bacterium]